MKCEINSLVISLTCLFFVIGSCSGQDCNNSIKTGEATYYEGIAGSSAGNCSLPVANKDVYYAALNNIDYDGSNACGSCILVEGPKGRVKVKIVDRCPECSEGDVDMTQEAFSEIADIIDGRVLIKWSFVPCYTNFSGQKISINFKEGSSPFWTAIQLRNINHAVASLEYKNSSGNWILMDRKLYNFFVEPEGISSPMTLRATSVLGERLIIPNIFINTEVDQQTGLQFNTPEECEKILSIDEFNDNKSFDSVTLFPNPVKDYIFLKGLKNAKWKLLDLNGKLLFSGNKPKIDITFLTKGLYVIKIGIEGAFLKFVKK